MTRKVLPADAVSDHGGNVRFAGSGFIPSRRWPLPSALAPWQMAQLAAKIAAPACRAWGDVSSPAGALGVASRSHPEMTSEIVNRAMLVGRLRLLKHLVSKTLHLANNSSDKFIQTLVDSA
jgi:hypothetical protein